MDYNNKEISDCSKLQIMKMLNFVKLEESELGECSVSEKYDAFLSKLKQDSITHYIILKQIEAEDVRKTLIVLYIYDRVFSRIQEEPNSQDIIKGIGLLFEHLAEGEPVDENNTKFLGNGYTSMVFKVGRYVTKLSSDKRTYEVPYDPYIAQPLLRDCVKNEKGEPIVVIEVFNELDLDVKVDDLGKIVDDLRKRGINWEDDIVGNIGRLKEGDSNMRRIPPGDIHAGIIERKNEYKVEPPKSGDVVVLDVDDFIDMDR